MIKKSKIFEVYEEKRKKQNNLYTKNLVPGQRVYNEKLVKQDNTEYRQWEPNKSKLAATILKGSTNVGIRKGDVVLYLGCSTGTTASHISDMAGKNGFIFGLDSAPRVLREFVFLCEKRENMTALLEDANHPENYKERVCKADIVYQDIAQRNQAEIFIKNCDAFLKKGGYGLLAVKARSIDVTKKPKHVFKEVQKELEKKLTIIDYRNLEPYEMNHAMFVCKKK
ncbi:fibrillarin-like rRNA/tRNA 2'-O-methyltransferase [Candidatus Woesearchaeota archaeon]|nr:fibrillarin-like rRNA/tRNA 2'-O-methyltransferase [Candidatus Woesearchaeota archaeon]